MAYRFEIEETTRESFRRCTREELDRAIQELTDGVKADPVEAVHEARKALKMERALLRLARSALKTRLRRRENAALRDAAGLLSGTRDADVMLQALDGVAQCYAGQVPESTIKAVRSQVEAERELLRAHPDGARAIVTTAEELRAIRGRLDRWTLKTGGWKAISGGLEWAYRRGRKAYALARRDPTDENLHEWRKRAKDLWYDLRLLEPTAPRLLHGEVKAAHELADLLGDDHDLAVLHETVSGVAAQIAADVGPVLALIDHRRERLQEQAFASGRRIYAEKTGTFVRRLRAYWKAAHAEARAAGKPPVSLGVLVREAEVV
jgi:CHAD domain-containing protein